MEVTMKEKIKALIICFIAVPSLIICKTIARLVASLPYRAGLPNQIYPIIVTLVYMASAYLFIKLVASCFLKCNLYELRIRKPHIKCRWIIGGVLLIAFVYIELISLSGKFIFYRGKDLLGIMFNGILFSGIGYAFVEEIIYRGLCMGILEKNFNKYIAIIFPSILFGAEHLINGKFTILSTIQILFSGTIAGIMLSLIVYESDNIWNSIAVHFLWNFIQGFITIGTEYNDDALVTFITHSKNQFITGGKYGFECSIISNFGYIILSIVALFFIYRKSSK